MTANEKIEQALKRIEIAQRELYEAMNDVSMVIGFADEWQKIGEHADQVKGLWHRVRQRSLTQDIWKLDKI